MVSKSKQKKNKELNGERASFELDNGYNYSQVSFDDRYKQKRAEVDL